MHKKPLPKNTPNRIVLPFLLLALSLPLSARAAWIPQRTLASPDGALSFTLERDDTSGRFAWSVTLNGRAVVTRGALGIDMGSPNVGVIADEGIVSRVEAGHMDTTWNDPFGERSVVPDRYNQETLTIDHPGHTGLTVRLQIRACNEGIALRYLIDGAGPFTVKKTEKTSFPFPPGTQVWTSPSAQGPFTRQNIASVTGAVERPVLAEIASDLFAAVGEAALVRHARMRFTREGNALVAILAGDCAYSGSFATPWRFVRAAASPCALAQGNYFILNLNEPCKIADTSWIRPGKQIRATALTTANGKACVDFAVAQNLQYVLFDAGWYGPENNDASLATAVAPNVKLDLRQVIAYARPRGVGIILYVNRRGLENGRIDTLLPLYRSWGVAGIKFGFVQVGSQAATQWLHEQIAKCAEYKLIVDVHDEYRPTGFSRTWPNLLTVEGIRGDEEYKAPNQPCRNSTVLESLFTRSLTGSADQTNCYFNPAIVTRLGSNASQLAKTVLIHSALQTLFWYDQPPRPAAAGGKDFVPEMTFFRRLPTVWDETRFLEGYPGAHAAVARRSADRWFLAALNAAPGDHTFEIPLDFLPPAAPCRLELFYDDPAAATSTRVSLATRTVTSADTLTRTVKAANGFAAILTLLPPSGVATAPISLNQPTRKDEPSTDKNRKNRP